MQKTITDRFRTETQISHSDLSLNGVFTRPNSGFRQSDFLINSYKILIIFYQPKIL